MSCFENKYITTDKHPELKQGIRMNTDSRDNVYYIASAFYVKDTSNDFYIYSETLYEGIKKGWYKEKI